MQRRQICSELVTRGIQSGKEYARREEKREKGRVRRKRSEIKWSRRICSPRQQRQHFLGAKSLESLRSSYTSTLPDQGCGSGRARLEGELGARSAQGALSTRILARICAGEHRNRTGALKAQSESAMELGPAAQLFPRAGDPEVPRRLFEE